MRLCIEWPYRRREQNGRGRGRTSLFDEAQHRVVLPAGPSLHVARPDVLHPGVADRTIVVEQDADDEAFVVLSVCYCRTVVIRWHGDSPSRWRARPPPRTRSISHLNSWPGARAGCGSHARAPHLQTLLLELAIKI